MSYDSNWFKGSRVLFQECIDNGTPWDFFVMDVILHRVRYNGNNGGLDVGECYIGLRELGKIVGKDKDAVKRSLKRLDAKKTIMIRKCDANGTVIKVLLHSMFSNSERQNQDGSKTEVRHWTGSNLDIEKNRIEENNISIIPLVDINNTYKQGRTTTKGKLKSWDEVAEHVTPKVKAIHPFSDEFIKQNWEAIIAYDEGKPYKNRVLGAINWFNNKYTKKRWEESKPEESIADQLRKCGIVI